ncbi:MAG: carboxypeptidase regulatory-like domain-containing protein, partial [Sphingobacteriaceae bacterium]
FISVLISFFFSCQKSLHWTDGTPNNVISKENARLEKVVTNQTKETWLNGQVVNEQNQPVTGASVSCGNKTVITDNKGFYRFKEALRVNKDYALIKIEKPGFMTGYRTFTPNKTELAYKYEKVMLQATPAAKVVPGTGGTVTADNIKFTFTAESVVTKDGTPYIGNVNITARYIDPNAANFGFMMPGMLAGLNNNDQINAMQSFGMANVELKDDAGEKLEIAAGKTVKIEMPASATAPNSIPLWHFNEDYGIWVQQGVATKQGSVFVAEVNHFSIWNIDLEFNDFELNLKFQTNDTTPLANQLVSVYRANDEYVSTFYTDNAGEATLINCPSNEGLKVQLIFTCDTVLYSLAPLTQTRNDTIRVTGPSYKTYQLEGVVNECSNVPFAKHAFEMMLTGSNGSFIVLNGITNDTGGYNISTVLPICEASTFDVQTIAEVSGQYFYTAVTPIAEGVNDYNPVLCNSTSTTITLQPANNANELNFAGYDNGSNISAHLKELCAGAWTNNGVFFMRGAMKFDLSGIPANATIVSAKLTLFSIPDPQNGDQINANSGPANSMFIQRLTQDWNATTATWTNQPTATSTNQVNIPHTSQNFLDLVDINVTGIVRDMLTQGNHGFQMRLQNESIYNVRQFASSVHSNTAKHPKLVVAYIP